MTKEKDFAAFQKENNRKLKTVISDTRKNNQILKSLKDAAERQASHCNRELSTKRSQVDRLESENEKLENSGERCQSDLRDQKTSLG